MPAEWEKVSLKEKTSKCDELAGMYANTFKVGYNAYEFVLDFGQYFTENGEEHFHTRIVINPKYAKLFFELLKKSVEKYDTYASARPDATQD